MVDKYIVGHEIPPKPRRKRLRVPPAADVGGARALEEREWEIGKTAASIQFVHDAEEYLRKTKRISSGVGMTLRSLIFDIKKGRVVLQEYQTVEDFLATHRVGR